MKVLITGVAGFIGSQLAHSMLTQGHKVIGVDFFDGSDAQLLKKMRLNDIWNNRQDGKGIGCYDLDIADKKKVEFIFALHRFDIVVNLAGQAGVRASVKDPDLFARSNVKGFLNIIEACKKYEVKHLVYASSSSVYGMGDNMDMAFSTDDRTDGPVSFYAATKKMNELTAHVYSHLFNMRTTGLRFFTVYGPWGRPDMMVYKFTYNIHNNIPINIYNHGEMFREFTYIDDIIDGINIVIKNETDVKYMLYNIGSNESIKILDFIDVLEEGIGIGALRNLERMQDGDVYFTASDVAPLKSLGYEPKVKYREGIKRFLQWYDSIDNITHRKIMEQTGV
jgi:UDP-glucuronate 4-epimerase